jgi:hypothetical protein
MNNEFYQTLFATFVGVFLAFLLDRLAFRSESVRTRKNNKTKLKIALLSIIKSIEYNERHLLSLQETFTAKTTKVVLPINTFTWDAYKDDVFDFLDDISLRNDLIYFFLVAHTLKYLSDSYFILLGQNLNNKIDNPQWRDYIGVLRDNVIGFNNELLLLGERLIPKLKKVISENN